MTTKKAKAKSRPKLKVYRVNAQYLNATYIANADRVASDATCVWVSKDTLQVVASDRKTAVKIAKESL